ncbi:MAG: tRNA (adenosine(37)-N6)-threonylcarbamoyltransferase complex dimerization subunit type 1 TsaB [Bacillota bacterium]|nr:tRNA (adenosine(37)-N6)-threonylcarbamoyltransferase complex dimerization subunit type 1 TsaB [Bacillota bacterium]
MKVLAVDTSSTVAAVAVLDNEKLLGEYIINNKKTHSQKLMPMIKDLMDNLGVAPDEIDVYAASVGPGSFTGLRIGVTIIKAISYSLEKPVISIPTLDALAYNISTSGVIICPIMDARNNQVYTSIYKWDKEELVRKSEYMGIDIAELKEFLIKKDEVIYFVGDAVENHRNYLSDSLGDKCKFAPNNLLLHKASSVAQLAFLAAKSGKLESPIDMVPYYLRKSQAEQEYCKRNGV